MLIKGHPANERDGIVKRKRAEGDMLESVMVDFKPIAGSKLKEYAANWDATRAHASNVPPPFTLYGFCRDSGSV